MGTSTINVTANGGGSFTIAGNSGIASVTMVCLTLSYVGGPNDGHTPLSHVMATDAAGAFSWTTLTPSGTLQANLFLIAPADATVSSAPFHT